MENNLQTWANIASIATFIITTGATAVGIWGYLSYRLELSRKQSRLEDYLKAEKSKSKDKGQRSLLHLVRHVGLTEDEIIKISFRSDKIKRRIKEDEEGYAKSMLFEYISD